MWPVNVWRYGRQEGLAPRLRLKAGPLSLFLERSELISIRLGEREVLRRVYAAVRDRNWGTLAPVLTKVRQEIGENAFHITFGAEHRENEIHFSWQATLTGDATGTVSFLLDGQAHTTFLKNRIGFCVLHPDTCAGSPCRIQHADGTEESSTFPEFISPHQPFREIRSIAHEVAPQVWAEVRFEGDIFEMEDQRNWTDASFKTYCTPLRIPFPAEIAAGTRVRQSVTLRLIDPGRAAFAAEGFPCERPAYEIRPAGPRSPLPALGLGIASHGLELSDREQTLLTALGPSHLRVDLDLSRSDSAGKLERAAREALALRAKLEVALFLSDAAAGELAALLPPLSRVPSSIARFLVFHTKEASTSEKWIALTKKLMAPARPGVSCAAGTNAYFTELNRGPRPVFADEVVFSLNPQIHAFDNGSMMETLPMQEVTVLNARRLSQGKPVVVSPVTLKPRFNAVATGPVVGPLPGELPQEVDVRQMSLFGAAWTLGSLACLTRSGASSLTYYETTGWRGVMETVEGSSSEGFPALPGCVFPLYHVLADLGEFRGGSVLHGHCVAPLSIAAFTVEARGQASTFLANLEPEMKEAVVRGALGRGRLRLLDETNVERACREPDAFRTERGEVVSPREGQLRMTLRAYATARIDWEVA